MLSAVCLGLLPLTPPKLKCRLFFVINLQKQPHCHFARLSELQMFSVTAALIWFQWLKQLKIRSTHFFHLFQTQSINQDMFAGLSVLLLHWRYEANVSSKWKLIPHWVSIMLTAYIITHASRHTEMLSCLKQTCSCGFWHCMTPRYL